MKKCLILISVVCLLVSMTACGKTPVETAPETTASQPAESTQPQSVPPTEETKSAEPETTAPETVSQEETQPDTAGWPDVVKLVNWIAQTGSLSTTGRKPGCAEKRNGIWP